MISAVLNSAPVRRIMRFSPAAMSLALPLIRAARRERTNTGGSTTADYCYSVFLRHYKNGANVRPNTVMEFGPGDSIGVGLCWILAGANTYYAMDAERYASPERSLEVLDGLVRMFRTQLQVMPYSDAKPAVDDSSFPAELAHVDLSSERLDAIRQAIRDMGGDGGQGPVRIAYRAPWSTTSSVPAGSVDLAFSQAVLEHVMDLADTYATMARWVRPGGFLSHQIDLRSHGTSFDWNGHWSYSPSQWARANNRQTYRVINRVPCSGHLELMRDVGFEIVGMRPARLHDGIRRDDLAPQFADMPDNDLTCSGIHVLAQRMR